MVVRRSHLVVGAFTLFVLAACQKQNEKPSTETHAAPSASATVSGAPAAPSLVAEPARSTPAPPESTVSVRVLEAGGEPRQTLRYAFKQGLSRKLALLQKSHIAMKVGTQQLPATDVPPIKTLVRWEVTAVDGETATISQHVLSANVEGKSNDPTVAQLRQVMGDFKAIKGTSRTDSRGGVLDFTLDTESVNNPQFAQLLESVKQSLTQMTVQLPEEPVGIGGKWQVTSHVEQFGVKLTQQTTYTVIRLDDKSLQADISVEQSSPPGKVTPPGMPAGATVDLLALNSTGKGTTRIDFQGGAAESKLDLSLTMKLQVPEGPGVPAGGQTLEMSMNTGVKVQPVK